MAIEGATDTEVFRASIRNVLCPTLRAGNIVVMDNLLPHKNALTLALIEQAGASALFLPAYSPDLDPIEKMWSKGKQIPPQRRSPNPARHSSKPSPRPCAVSPLKMPGVGLPHAAIVLFKML